MRNRCRRSVSASAKIICITDCLYCKIGINFDFIYNFCILIHGKCINVENLLVILHPKRKFSQRKVMNKRKTRLQAILEILTNNCFGSQDELSRLLAARGFLVTQATLSRDLKALRTTKVATDFGDYRYIVTQPGEVPVDEIWEAVPSTAQSGTHYSVLSISLSGNILVIKTRTGYASGLAYDIDQLDSPYLLGTISGADTVLAVVNDRYTREELFEYFKDFFPEHVLEKAHDQFL